MNFMGDEYFDWSQKFGSINKLFQDEFGKTALSKISEYSDTKLDWFLKLYSGKFQDEVDCLSAIQHCLKRRYAGIRFYHLCRQLSVIRYYQKGLVSPSRELITNQFFEVNNKFSKYDRDKIYRTIDSVFSSIEICHPRRLSIYLYMDREEAFSLEGKNFLRCPEIYDEIFNGLPENISNILRPLIFNMSIPTIFIVNVPFELITSENICSIAKLVAWKWAGLYFDNQKEENFQLDFGFDFPNTINESHISKHRHPREHDTFDCKNSIYCDKCKKRIKR